MTEDDAAQARGLLGLVAERMPAHPDLVAAVHGRGRRIVRRRRAVSAVTGLAALAAVVVMLPLGSKSTVTPVDPAAPPAVRTASPPPTTSRAQAPTWSDDFAGAALDRRRWTAVYDGAQNTPFGRWAASEVSVAGGAVHLAVSRTAASSLPATSGGIGAQSSAALTGRWEVRMRMSTGNGVIGQFALVGEPRDGVAQTVPRYLATLDAGTGVLTVHDEAADRDARVRVGLGGWHTVALELTRTSVRWQVDGRVLADWATRPGAVRVWPALQSLLAGPDCGAASLPADCGGRRTGFPQQLSVTQLRFWSR